MTNFGDVSIQTNPHNGTTKTRSAPPLRVPVCRSAYDNSVNLWTTPPGAAASLGGHELR
jgi:hypothetical protein